MAMASKPRPRLLAVSAQVIADARSAAGLPAGPDALFRQEESCEGVLCFRNGDERLEGRLRLFRSTNLKRWVLGAVEFKPTTLTEEGDLNRVASIPQDALPAAELPVGKLSWRYNTADSDTDTVTIKELFAPLGGVIDDADWQLQLMNAKASPCPQLPAGGSSGPLSDKPPSQAAPRPVKTAGHKVDYTPKLPDALPELPQEKNEGEGAAGHKIDFTTNLPELSEAELPRRPMGERDLKKALGGEQAAAVGAAKAKPEGEITTAIEAKVKQAAEEAAAAKVKAEEEAATAAATKQKAEEEAAAAAEAKMKQEEQEKAAAATATAAAKVKEAEAARVAAEKAEERVAAEQAEAERVAAEQAEAERVEAEAAEHQRLQLQIQRLQLLLQNLAPPRPVPTRPSTPPRRRRPATPAEYIRCSDCGKDKARGCYSKRQWEEKPAGEERCKNCLGNEYGKRCWNGCDCYNEDCTFVHY